MVKGTGVGSGESASVQAGTPAAGVWGSSHMVPTLRSEKAFRGVGAGAPGDGTCPDAGCDGAAWSKLMSRADLCKQAEQLHAVPETDRPGLCQVQLKRQLTGAQVAGMKWVMHVVLCRAEGS